MRILALLLILISTSLAWDLNKYRGPFPPSKFHSRVHIYPTDNCPTNPLQPDGKLPLDRTLTTKIYQISRLRPNEFFWTDGWASVTPRDKCTVFLFEFDVVKAWGKTCNLVMDVPVAREAQGLYRLVGPGKFTFHTFSPRHPPPARDVTWNSQPPIDNSQPPLSIGPIQPGFSYIVESGPCYIPPWHKGRKFVRSGMLCSDETNFQFKENVDRCPVGLYTILTNPYQNV